MTGGMGFFGFILGNDLLPRVVGGLPPSLRFHFALCGVRGAAMNPGTNQIKPRGACAASS